jgi:hypothetical protein
LTTFGAESTTFSMPADGSQGVQARRTVRKPGEADGTVHLLKQVAHCGCELCPTRMV